MKKIRMICAALAIGMVTSFGGMAFAADTQAKLPEVESANTTVAQEVNSQVVSMLSGYAEVVELSTIEMDSEFIVIKPEDESYPEIRLNISGDTLIVDNQTGQTANLADIKAGDRIYTYYSPAMTRSIPPQSQAYLLLTKVGEDTPAHFLTVEDWDADVSGDVVITTDNGGLLVRVPEANWLGGAPQLQNGQRFLAWYDIVLTSYPGQALADKAMLAQTAPVSTDDAAPADDVVELPAAAATITATVTVAEVVNEADEQYLLAYKQDGSEIRLNFATEGENSVMVVDAQTGVLMDITSVQPGDQIRVNHNAAATFSLPPQSWLNYVLVNLGDNPPVGIYRVEKWGHDDNFDLSVLTDNGGLWIYFNRDVWVQDDMSHMLGSGDYFLAWYDTVMESYPAQTVASRVLEITDQKEYATKLMDLEWADKYYNNLQTSKLVLDDMVIENAVQYRTHGVPLVPVRLVAEHLGFDVEWNEAEMSAHLTNGTIQTTVYDGGETYYYATAIPGAVGMTAPISLDGITRMIDDTLYVPAELFELLGFEVTVSGDTMTIN